MLADQVRQQCRARELANIIYASGYLQLPVLVELLMPLFLQQHSLQAANPQGLANTLYGSAKAGLKLSAGDIQQLLVAFSALLPDAATGYQQQHLGCGHNTAAGPCRPAAANA